MVGGQWGRSTVVVSSTSSEWRRPSAPVESAMAGAVVHEIRGGVGPRVLQTHTKGIFADRLSG